VSGVDQDSRDYSQTPHEIEHHLPKERPAPVGLPDRSAAELEADLRRADERLAKVDKEISAAEEDRARLAQETAKRAEKRNRMLDQGEVEQVLRLDQAGTRLAVEVQRVERRLAGLKAERADLQRKRAETKEQLGRWEAARLQAARLEWRVKRAAELPAECAAIEDDFLALSERYGRFLFDSVRVGRSELLKEAYDLQSKIDRKIAATGRRYVRLRVGPTPPPLRLEATIASPADLVAPPEEPPLQNGALEVTSVPIR
jgi:DNA repair exonuclease SbcCD ATPase subunit